MDWYYVANGQQAGPVDETQLAELARTGAILFDTLVWHEGLANWRPYGEVHLAGRQTTMPGTPPRLYLASPALTKVSASPGLECTKCGTPLRKDLFNLPELNPCSACDALLQVEAFPALFRPATSGHDGEPILTEGESSCFYHPQKKAVVPCEACGRFLCALCDCAIKDQHFCPACLESGQKKKSIKGLESVRVLHMRQALILAILPLFISGMAAIYIALRYRKEPGSLVAPMRWAFPTAVALGSLQTALFLFLILRAWMG
jgi:hypothetical protein